MAADGMRALRLVLWREYLQRVRSRSFIASTILTPIFMLGISVLPAVLAAPHLIEGRHIVIACSDSALANALGGAIGGHRRIAHFKVEIDPDTGGAERARLTARVRAGRIDGFVWLDEAAITSGHVTYVSSEGADFLEQDYLQGAIGGAVMRERLMRHGLAADQIGQALAPIALEAVALNGGTPAGAVGDSSGYAVGIFLLFFLEMSLLSYGLMVMRSVLDDKTSRVMEVLLCAATPRELMAGKILGIGMVNLTQVSIWAAMVIGVAAPIAAFTHIAIPVHLPLASVALFAIYYVLGYLLYSSVYAAVGAAFNSVDEAQNWNFMITLPLIISGVVGFSLAEHPASTPAVVLSMIPLFAPAIMSMRIAAHAAPAWQVTLSLGLLLASIYAAVAISSRIYRVGILMYGKRPSVAEIVRWLRYA